MTSYIIKSILCSGLLLLFYHLFLGNEKMHRFNRFYLLASIVFALTIPVTNIEIKYNDVNKQLLPHIKQTIIIIDEGISKPATSLTSSSQEWLKHIPVMCYCLFTFLLLARLTRNFYSILIKKRNKKIIPYQSAKLVLLPEKTVTYTFLSNIFVEESAFIQNKIEDEILTHELAHVRQKHTLDVIFIEMLQVFFWINPILIFYKKAIQLNHEFLADEAVLKIYQNPRNYQILLLDKISGNRQIDLTSSFNYSITKKRLTMITKTTNSKRRIFKQSAVAIFTFGLALIFSEKIYSQVEKVSTGIKSEKKISEVKPGNGLSMQEFEEFNKNIEKYTVHLTNKKGRRDRMVQMKPEMENQMYDLYLRMNDEQQKVLKDDGTTFFKMDIPVKKAPTPKMFENWKIPTIFGVWINNKRVSNSELEKYKYTDIAEYSLSKLYGGALKGRIYKYQLDLLTNDYFDKTYDERVANRVIIMRTGFYDEAQKTK